MNDQQAPALATAGWPADSVRRRYSDKLYGKANNPGVQGRAALGNAAERRRGGPH
ncbi:hypothetical protein LCGC14_1098330 [marine sediment metagenome]|uniref:Uncharacterized protein n=1 Tax=marine sediment metagenome TaxID=412755 RepID=A0A0F9MER7_9ZZZZ